MTFRFRTALAAAAAAVLAVPAALAGDIAPAGANDAAYVVHKLAAEGQEVREIEFDDGRYEVDIAAGDGTTWRAEVDPFDAAATPRAVPGRRAGRDGAPAGSQSASLIAQAVDAAGYGRIAEMELDDGAWKVKALDAGGRMARLRVDPLTGAVSPRVRE